MSLLVAENLCCAFSGKRIFDGVSFEASRGEFIGIAGLNGSGKTSLLKILQRWIQPAAGNVRLDSRQISSYSSRELAKRIAVVPQRITIAFDFTAFEMVMLGRTPYLGFLDCPTAHDRIIAEEAMRKTDSWRFAESPVRTLSSGELQRVSIATALAQQAEILILDEPTTALDLRQQNRLIRMLESLKGEGKTILLATHDLPLLYRMSDKVLLLHDGSQLGFDAPGVILNRNTLRDVFESDPEAIYVR